MWTSNKDDITYLTRSDIELGSRHYARPVPLPGTETKSEGVYEVTHLRDTPALISCQVQAPKDAPFSRKRDADAFGYMGSRNHHLHKHGPVAML
jgi:hypothetical protein